VPCSLQSTSALTGEPLDIDRIWRKVLCSLGMYRGSRIGQFLALRWAELAVGNQGHLKAAGRNTIAAKLDHMAALIGYIGMGQPWPLLCDVHQVVISRTIWRAFPSLVTDSKPLSLGYHCRRGGAGGSASACWPFHQENVGGSESHSPLVSLRDHGQRDQHLLGQDRNSRKIA
jgi:hypothetical protein